MASKKLSFCIISIGEYGVSHPARLKEHAAK